MSHVDEALLVAYADDALPPSVRSGVEAHLAACAECRALVEEERSIAQRAAAVLGYGDVPEEIVAPPFDAIIRRSERADAPTAPARARRRFMPPLAWAALLVVGLGAAWIARVLLVSPGFTAAPVRTEASSEADLQGEPARGADAAIRDAAPPPTSGRAEADEGDQRVESRTRAEAAETAAPQAVLPAAPAEQQAAAESGAAAPPAPPSAATEDARASDMLLRRTAAQRPDTSGFTPPAAPPAPMAAADAAEKAMPGTGAVTGRIVDEATSEPLVGGRVVVAGTTLGAITDREGEFVIRDVPPGTQTLRVDRIGYAAVDQPVRVLSDGQVTANFVLRATGLTLETLTVTGETAAPGAVLIDSARAAWRGSDAAAAGTVVHGIPGAAVELAWIGAAEAAWRVRLLQRVDGAALEIVEWRVMPDRAAGTAGTLADGRSYLFTTTGGVPLLLRGSVPLERLRTLAGMVRPLR